LHLLLCKPFYNRPGMDLIPDQVALPK